MHQSSSERSCTFGVITWQSFSCLDLLQLCKRATSSFPKSNCISEKSSLRNSQTSNLSIIKHLIYKQYVFVLRICQPTCQNVSHRHKNNQLHNVKPLSRFITVHWTQWPCRRPRESLSVRTTHGDKGSTRLRPNSYKHPCFLAKMLDVSSQPFLCFFCALQ